MRSSRGCSIDPDATAHGVHVAETKNFENPCGMVTGPAVAVEIAFVPASALDVTVTALSPSGILRRVTVVPTGMFDAARSSVTATSELMEASGRTKPPVGVWATSTPPTLVTRTRG